MKVIIKQIIKNNVNQKLSQPFYKFPHKSNRLESCGNLEDTTSDEQVNIDFFEQLLDLRFKDLADLDATLANTPAAPDKGSN